MNVIKRLSYILIVIAAIGISVPISLSQGSQQTSWLFTSNSSIFRPPFLNYIIPDEDSNISNDDFRVENLNFFGFFLIAGIGLLISPINSYRESLFDKVETFRNILSFASLSLRSPPLFS